MTKRPPAAGPDARSRLLDAADAAFYRHGIRATGIDGVSRRAGVTKRTPYHHFASKDDLIAEYIRGRNASTFARMTEAAMAGGPTFGRRVDALFGYFARRPDHPAWNGCALARAAAEFSDAPGHPASTEPAVHKLRFERWLVDGARRDGYARPTLRARQLIVLVDGAVTQLMIHRDGRYATAAGRAAAAAARRVGARCGERRGRRTDAVRPALTKGPGRSRRIRRTASGPRCRR